MCFIHNCTYIFRVCVASDSMFKFWNAASFDFIKPIAILLSNTRLDHASLVTFFRHCLISTAIDQEVGIKARIILMVAFALVTLNILSSNQRGSNQCDYVKSLNSIINRRIHETGLGQVFEFSCKYLIIKLVVPFMFFEQ